MMPASATDTVSIILYAWFAIFGFVAGLVVALVCFHLAAEPVPVEGLQDGPEESGPQEKPAVRVSSTQRAAARGTGSGGNAAPLLSQPVALCRYGGHRTGRPAMPTAGKSSLPTGWTAGEISRKTDGIIVKTGAHEASG
jgi:hypothetical protein